MRHHISSIKAMSGRWTLYVLITLACLAWGGCIFVSLRPIHNCPAQEEHAETAPETQGVEGIEGATPAE